MTPAGSFRRRLMLGSVLWIVGLLAITTAIGVTIIHHYPHLVGFVHNSALVVFATVCLLGGLSVVRHGLSPFAELRERLAAVHQGRDRRVEGRYPSEVQPLVDDLNALLEHRDHTVKRAIAKAGDLAHGLKTPLTIIAQEAKCLERAGQHGSAAAIAEQVERMRLQIDYQLTRARASAAGITYGESIEVRPVAEKLVRTMTRLYAGKDLDIAIEIPDSSAVRCESEDLEEMLGNVLENACKWARSAVAITASCGSAEVVILIDDDGPGIDPAKREHVLERGVRADEAAPGSGLGLAIVADLVELYGGAIGLTASPLGGLRATLKLASA